jgi:pimeloyl-ACP methyl ester carboxylesterase
MSKPFHVPQVSTGQAYAMLGGAALMMTLAMGIRQNLGLFQAPASKELGIAISDFALAISVQQVAWGLSQPIAGIFADKYGTRWVAMIGSALFILGIWMTATAQADEPLAGVRGLVFLGFPLHPPGRPDDKRAEHLARVEIPMLFLQGDRDDFADLKLLKPVLERLRERATLHVVDGGDHSFKVRKRSGRTDADVMGELVDAIVKFTSTNVP